MSSFLLFVDFIAQAHPSRTAWPCASSSFSAANRRLACYTTPADRWAIDVPTHIRFTTGSPVPPQSDADENRRAEARTSPSPPCIEATSAASKGQTFTAHRITPVLQRSKFPGNLSLWLCPFRWLNLRKMALGEQVRVSRFFKERHVPQVRSEVPGTAVPVYPFRNQPLSARPRNRCPAAKKNPFFSLTKVIPTGCGRRRNKLWITFRMSLFYICFFCFATFT